MEHFMRTTIVAVVLLCSFCFTQEQKPPATAPAPPISPSARLLAAKTAFVKNAEGSSDIPYNVIDGGLEGWARLMLVDSPEKADIVIEISAPEESLGTSVSSTSDTGGKSTSRSTRDLYVEVIKMSVYDARTHLMLWTATEKPKGAFKDKAREDNLVAAAQRLLTKFRDRLEPLPQK
jgi:hypothetical protein